MSVLLGYIKAMGLSRKEYKVAWYAFSVTMITHIIKVLLVVDDNNTNKWLKEIDGDVETLTNKNTDANLKKDTLYKEIYQGIALDSKDILFCVRVACKRYMDDDSNKGFVKLREFSNDELARDINEILKGCIYLMRVFKTHKTDYERGSVPQMTAVKLMIKKYHARDYRTITNPDKEVK